MMKKGAFGYRKRYKIRTAILILIFLLLIMVQVYLSKIASGGLSKLLLVSGILTVLPMANIASPFLVSLRFAALSKEDFEKTIEYRDFLLYDLLLTTKEQVIAADMVYIHPKRLYFYISNRIDDAKVRSYIKEVLYLHRLKREVILVRDVSVFLQSMEKEEKKTSRTKEEQQENKDIKEIFSNLSI